MEEEEEEQQLPPSPAPKVVFAMISVLVCLLGISYLQNPETPNVVPPPVQLFNKTENHTQVIKDKEPIHLPSCTLQQQLVEISRDIKVKPKKRKETIATSDSVNSNANVVIYIAVGLLLISVLVALLDVYRAKMQPDKDKRQLTKRCSLADLTVLRHNRREVMRRDSYVEDTKNATKSLGVMCPNYVRRNSQPSQDVHLRISPRHRKYSIDYYEDDVHTYDIHHNRVRIIRRY